MNDPLEQRLLKTEAFLYAGVLQELRVVRCPKVSEHIRPQPGIWIGSNGTERGLQT